jgi:repressor LexA
MKAKGFSRRGLATKAGIGQTSVRDLLEKTDNPGIGTLHKIAEALEMPFEEISGAERVPLLGEIGAGGAVAYFKDDHEFETVPRPPLATGRMMALQVMGESMLPKYEPGDIVYVRRDHEGILPAYLGRYCAVHLADGGTYLKILAAGSVIERYTLRSLNAADMENVEVIWASPVSFVMPRQ